MLQAGATRTDHKTGWNTNRFSSEEELQLLGVWGLHSAWTLLFIIHICISVLVISSEITVCYAKEFEGWAVCELQEAAAASRRLQKNWQRLRSHFPSWPIHPSQPFPHLQIHLPDSTSKSHKSCFTSLARTQITLTTAKCPAAAGGECPVRGRAAELTCVRWRAAAPRLRSQLPSTSSCTRTLGRPTGQQLLFHHQSLWSVHHGLASTIIIERIAVIFLRCRLLINCHRGRILALVELQSKVNFYPSNYFWLVKWLKRGLSCPDSSDEVVDCHKHHEQCWMQCLVAQTVRGYNPKLNCPANKRLSEKAKSVCRRLAANVTSRASEVCLVCSKNQRFEKYFCSLSTRALLDLKWKLWDF